MRRLAGFILLLLIALSLMLVPYIDGVLFKKNYLDFLAALQKSNPNQKITLQKYDLGWWASDATVAIVIPPVPDKIPFPINITLQQHIKHGPLVYDAMAKQWVWATGIIESIFHLPPTIETLLGNLGNQGFLHINTIAHFNDYKSQIIIPPLTFQFGGFFKLNWQGLQSTVEAKLANQRFVYFKSNWVFKPINIQANNASVVSENINLQAELFRHPIGLWYGTDNLTVPEISVVGSSTNQSFTINNLNFTQESNITGSNLYNLQWSSSLDKLSVGDFLVSASNMHFTVSNLNAAGLQNLIMSPVPIQPPMEPLEIVSSKLPELMTPQTEVTENIFINTSLGNLSSQGRFYWNFPVKTLDDFENANYKLDMRIAIALVLKLVEFIDNNDEISKQPVQPSPLSQVIVTQSSLLHLIDSWVSAGQLSLYTSMQLKDLIQMHMPLDAFNTNMDEYVAKKEITADMSNKLKSEYMIVAKSFLANSQNTAPPTVTQPINKADQLSHLIDSWVRQGFITLDKNEYVISIVRDANGLKLNGLDASPVLEALNTLSNPQPPVLPQVVLPGPTSTPTNPGVIPIESPPLKITTSPLPRTTSRVITPSGTSIMPTPRVPANPIPAAPTTIQPVPQPQALPLPQSPAHPPNQGLPPQSNDGVNRNPPMIESNPQPASSQPTVGYPAPAAPPAVSQTTTTTYQAAPATSSAMPYPPPPAAAPATVYPAGAPTAVYPSATPATASPPAPAPVSPATAYPAAPVPVSPATAYPAAPVAVSPSPTYPAPLVSSSPTAAYPAPSAPATAPTPRVFPGVVSPNAPTTNVPAAVEVTTSPATTYVSPQLPPGHPAVYPADAINVPGIPQQNSPPITGSPAITPHGVITATPTPPQE